ncbi:hypothetical protein RhiirB3_458069, partial [Rhizophagus irregularis]
MIKEINDIMKINNDNPFIQSIRSYFALELNSFDYIKQHEIIKEEFTWLDDCKDKKITYLSKLLKPIKRINFEVSARNLDKNSFLSIFFKYHESLKLMKHLYPIIRFVKILSFKLEHRLTKIEAQNMTFHEFIKKESADDNDCVNANFKSLFEEFAFKDDTNLIFDLQKIEMKLAKKLIHNKVYFEMEDNQFYLKNFSFKHELFYYSPRILFEIKKILPQEPISEEKRLIILALLDPSKSLYNSSNSIDLPEVISLFETILCFIKELSIKHNNILILDLIDQWLKLMRYDITYADILKEFSLKHIISFYELIEEQ